MILITGVTGHLGTATVEQLLKKMPANQIVGLARDKEKAASLQAKGVQIRFGDYDDVASLDGAMQGVEKVLLIASTNEDHRVRQHRNVLDAAKKAGIGCFAYTSRALKNRDTLTNQLMKDHFQTEDLIKESGLNFVIFQNILYMDTLPQFVGEKVMQTGINLPTAEGKVSFALRREMGEAMANALSDGDCANKTYQLTGSEAHSFGDIAATLAKLSGKDVKYTPVKKADYETQLKAKGLPNAVIAKIVGFLTDIKNGQEGQVSSDLETLLGRKPASLEQGLKELFSF